MSRAVLVSAGVLVGALLGYQPSPTSSRIPTTPERPTVLRPIPTTSPTPAPTGSTDPQRTGPGRAPAGTEPVRPTPTASPRSRGSTPAPARRPRVIVRGAASWYCLPGRSSCTSGFSSSGLYAAAGPALRRELGDWRGKTVTVRAGARTVRVRLVDWCACRSGRVLDLYGSAFAQLAPLSRGVIKVEVLR